MTFLPSIAKKLLLKHEGLSLTPYTDTEGNITIGVGRSLSTRGITESEALHLLANDIVYFHKELLHFVPWYYKLDAVRQLALLDMAVNMGVTGLLGFKHMLRAIKAGRWTVAEIEALDSKWARQVGKRAETVARMLKTGELPDGLVEDAVECSKR